MISAISCVPSNKLSIDILTPAEFPLPDTGKVVILNTSYLPFASYNGKNLMPYLNPKEQHIFDTLITNNLFNGLFSVLNESPVQKFRDAEYQELRSGDTLNFLNPVAPDVITDLCNSYQSSSLIAMEIFSFTYNHFYSQISDFEYSVDLEVRYEILWRIYKNTGEILDEFRDIDTLFWFYPGESFLSDKSDRYRIPQLELSDALSELFFMAGENYAQRISPYWSTISRPYYQIFK